MKRQDSAQLVQRGLPNSTFMDGYGIVGLSFRTADLELRSRLSISKGKVPECLRELKKRGVTQAAVLSTCNRIEIYFANADSAIVESVLIDFCDVPSNEARAVLYTKSGGDVPKHLFRVASGLDSAVIGETEILAQIKDSWEIAREEGMIKGHLELLLQKALVASKRVRTQTQLCRGVTSVASLSVREAQRLIPDLPSRRILLVGAGRTAERVAKELHCKGIAGYTITSRTFEHAGRLADMYSAHAAPLSDLQTLVHASDIVFLAVSVSEPLICPNILAGIDHPLLMVDLSMPKACDETVESLPNVCLLHLDGLAERCAQNAELRLAEIPKSESIIDEELAAFAEACVAREAAASIKRLQDQAERVRQASLELLWAKHKPTEDPKILLEELSKKMAKGILQTPIEKLRDPGLEAADRALIAEAFGGPEAEIYRD